MHAEKGLYYKPKCVAPVFKRHNLRSTVVVVVLVLVVVIVLVCV